MVFGPTKNIYKNLEALFAVLVNKDLEQPNICSIRLFKYIKSTKIDTLNLNIINIKTIPKLKFLVFKKDTITMEKE